MNTMKRIFLCSIIGLAILFSDCEQKDIPIVSTTYVTLISPSSVVINGKLLSYGECDITLKGF